MATMHMHARGDDMWWDTCQPCMDIILCDAMWWDTCQPCMDITLSSDMW